MRSPQLTPTAACLLLAAALSGCATEPGPSDSARTDVHCVREAMVPITVGQQVYMVPGHCAEWTVGPTRREREEFDRRNGREGGAQ